jgi:CRP-like cAMP-binding protein
VWVILILLRHFDYSIHICQNAYKKYLRKKLMADTIYNAKEIIFTKGDPSEFAYVIKSGKVEILDEYPEKSFRIALLNEGEIFGEMGLVDERPRTLTALALSETRVAKISRDEFIDLILHQPEDAFNYLGMFFERLRAMNMRVAHNDELPKSKAGKPKEFTITLIPKTPLTAKAIAADGLQITRFPFRIGRRSTRNEDPLEVNDLLLPDTSPFNVSRNHFSIEKSSDAVYIHDRGSYLGTIVNAKVIGGHHHGAWTALDEGENEVIAGSQHSPFRFRIDVFAK